MFKNIVRTAIISVMIGLGALGATAATAQAGDVRFGVYIGGPGYGFYAGEPRHHYRDHRHHRPRYRDVCTPDRAVHKAARLGVRRAHVTRLNRRVVVVRGTKHGYPVRVRFANDRGCPVLAIR